MPETDRLEYTAILGTTAGTAYAWLGVIAKGSVGRSVHWGWPHGGPPLAPLEAGRSIRARFALTHIASPAFRWLTLAGRGSNRCA